jgi:hypothetical protein
MRRLVLLMAVTLAACGGSPGRITNAQRAPGEFVTERQAFLVGTPSGLTRVQLDGSGVETLVPPTYHLLAMSADASVMALGDRDTNLYVHDAATRRIRQVPQLDRRVGSAALSPDGTRVAVVRHADFSQPQAIWSQSEDDAIWLVDARSLAVEVLPKSRDELVTRLAWDRDGRSLLLGMFNSGSVRLDLATRARTPLAKDLAEVAEPTGGSATCARTGARLELIGFRGDQGIDLKEPGGARRLVTVVGRRRGFHDYQATIRNPIFSASCRYALFEFGTAVWVVEVEKGVVGKVIEGYEARPLRSAPASAP